MKKILSSLFIFVMLLTLVSSAQDSLGTYTKGQPVTLLQICGTCSYNNITSVVFPNSTHQQMDVQMVKRGMEYTFEFNNTNQTGIYLVNGFGDLDGVDSAWAYEFEVTEDGQEVNFQFIWIVLIIAVLIIALGFWKEDFPIILLGSMCLTFVGLYFIINGIAGIKNMTTTYSISILILFISAYIGVRAGYELIISEQG